MNLKSKIIAGVAAATLGVASLSTPALARGGHGGAFHGGGGGFHGGGGWHGGGGGWHGGGGGWHHGGGWRGGGWGGPALGLGIVGGLAAGALAAGAYNSWDYGYGYGPGVYGYDSGYDCPPTYDQWGNYLGRRCVGYGY